MISFKNSIYTFLSNKFIFKLIYLFTTLLVSTIGVFIPGIKFLNKFLIAWGMLLIIINFYELLKSKRKLYSFEITLYVFLGLTLILTIINYPTVENIKIWLINTMIFTVIFSIDTYKDKVILEKELTIISYLFVGLTFILSSISANMILIQRKILIVDNYIGESITYSFNSLFSNENSLGIAAVLSLVISIYLLLDTKSLKLKTFNIINILIQIFALIMSNSRSPYLVILSLLFVYIYVYIKNKYIRFTIIFIPLSLLGILITRYFDKIAIFLSGREDYWLASLTLIKDNPLTGIGNTNLLPMIKSFNPTFIDALDLGGLHNIYLEIANVNGLIALSLIILFIILIFFFLVNKLDNYTNSEKLKYLPLLSLFIGISLINILETNLIYGVTFINLLFWIFCGYLICILDKNTRF